MALSMASQASLVRAAVPPPAVSRQSAVASSLQALPPKPCLLSFSASFASSLPQISRGSSRVPLPYSPAAAPLVVAMAEGAKKNVQKKKVDSAVKRAKQAEAHRTYNKARRTEMSTRMKKVFKALEELKYATSPTPEDLVPIEKLIGEAYAIIDKSVKVGTIHKNKGSRRKSRLARAKRELSIALGWYTPDAAAPAADAEAQSVAAAEA